MMTIFNFSKKKVNDKTNRLERDNPTSTYHN